MITIEPTRERLPAPTLQRARLLLLISAQFLVMLDTSIVNIALPSIQDDLRLTTTSTAWVVNMYFLAFGGFLLLAGRAADIVGRRRMFLTGAAVLTVATLIAGLAPSTPVLLAARALQGVGAASLSPAALSMLLVLFPGTGRARAMAAWGAASTLGGAIGVLAGGLITASLGWSFVFFVTLPISLVALVAGPHLLDRFATGGASRGFDAPGAATITGTALAVIYGTLAIADHGWTSTQSLVSFGIAGTLLVAFIMIERASHIPLVPLELFRSRSVSVGAAVSLLGGAARASTFFLVALYLQQGLAMNPRAAGLAMVPTSLAGFAASLWLLPRLVRALGPARTLTIGLIVLGVGQLWLARTPPEADYIADVLPGLLLAAAGVALSFTPSTMVIASTIPLRSAGLASGLANASSQIGAALGISAFSAIAAARAQTSSVAGSGVANFHAAFTATAVVALTAAALTGVLLARRTVPLAQMPTIPNQRIVSN